MAALWSRFWGLKWWIKWPVISVVLLIILGALLPEPPEEARTAASAAGTASAGEQQQAPQSALSLEERVAKSYRDNRGFMVRAVNDNLKVEWWPELEGLLKVDVHPELLNEADALTVTSHVALVASKAVWSTYPEVQELQVSTLAVFTDNVGAKNTFPAATIRILRPTGERFQYDGLKDRVIVDNKMLFCTADHYQLHPSVFASLGSKGCLVEWGVAK